MILKEIRETTRLSGPERTVTKRTMTNTYFSSKVQMQVPRRLLKKANGKQNGQQDLRMNSIKPV